MLKFVSSFAFCFSKVNCKDTSSDIKFNSNLITKKAKNIIALFILHDLQSG